MRSLSQVVPGAYQLRVPGSSVFLLLDGQVTVVDAGGRRVSSAVLGAIEHLGRSAQEIAYLVATHCHVDHVAGLAYLQRNTPGLVAVHEAEAVYVQGRLRPPSPLAEPLLAHLTSPFRRLTSLFPAVPVHVRLTDGHRLSPMGGIEVIHTPGHTPGSVSLFLRSHGLLIVGDALECRRGRLGPPSRRFTADMPVARASIRRLAELEPEVIAFSHFPPLREKAAHHLRELANSLD